MAAESATTETVDKNGTADESTVEVKGNGETTSPPQTNTAKASPEEEDEDLTPAKKRTGGSADEKTESRDAPDDDESENDDDEEDQKSNLDDDQNVENPAYIPKTGRFYMHDDGRRVDVNSQEDGDDRRNSKKSRADGDWKHDRFDEKFQRPKTKKQIVTKYGFDIRIKEGETPDDKETTAPESTEDDSSDARHLKQKPRRVTGNRGSSSGATRGGGSRGTVGRRPMKQREREDTVDESEGKGDEEEEARPAQKRNVKQVEKPRKTKPAPPQSSEENEEEEDDEDQGVRRGQRRAVPLRRGASGASRLRGRMNQGPPRRHSGSQMTSSRQSPRGNDRFSPRGESRGGGSRYSNPADRNDDRFENHRRGVIRGASRGTSGIATRGFSGRGGSAIRGGVRGSTAPRYGSGVRRTDTSEQSEGYHRGAGSGTDYSSPRPHSGQNQRPPQQRPQQPQAQSPPTRPNNYSQNNNSYRGSSTPVHHPHPSANVYPSTRGNYSGNHGNHGPVEFVPRGGHHGGHHGGGYHGPPQGHHQQQQKRFVQGPPMVAVGVVPPPQMTRGTTSGHGGQQNNSQGGGQRIRQPTDVVYFDPQQQQARQLPPRSKKVIPIVDPNKADQK
ncbi:unnamed protein product [Caenorhabditis nigoni]